MKKLTVFTNFNENTRLLSDAEMGRLFRAMLKYASSGTEPSLSGNERFLWDTAKGDIDRQRESYEAICKINKANASYRSAPIRTEASQSAPIRTEPKEEKKRKEKKINTPSEYIPESAFEIAMSEFKQFRKDIKAPLNDLSEKKIRNELERLSGGNEAVKIQIIDQSIRNNWKGVFAIKDRPQRNYEEHPVSDLDHLLVNLDE